MESGSPRWEQIESRLAYLERRDEANTKEILKLKTENIDLQKQVVDLKRDNAQAEERTSSVLDRVSGIKKKTVSRLEKIESEIERVKSRLEDFMKATSKQSDITTKELMALRGLQKLLNRQVVKQDEGGGQEKTKMELKDKVKANKRKIAANDEKFEEIEDKIKTMNIKVKSAEEKMEIMDEKLKDTTEKVKATEVKTTALDVTLKTHAASADERKKSVFLAIIRPKQPLVKGTWTRMDDCTSMTSLGTCFKKDLAEYQVPRNGLYGVGIRMSQEGTGKIRVGLRYKGILLTNALTTENGAVTSRFFVRTLKAGLNVSVDYSKVEGDAGVKFCEFFIFLVCPLCRKPQRKMTCEASKLTAP